MHDIVFRHEPGPLFATKLYVVEYWVGIRDVVADDEGAFAVFELAYVFATLRGHPKANLGNNKQRRPNDVAHQVQVVLFSLNGYLCTLIRAFCELLPIHVAPTALRDRR